MIPLKVISEYSLLKSLIKIDDLINFLKVHQIKVCGLCDDELFGVMEFYLKCQENDIKPLIGLDIIIDDMHFFIYAKNYDGYQRLLKINTKKFRETLNYDDLEDSNLLIVVPYASYDSFNKFNDNQNLYMGYSSEEEKQNALLITSNIVYFNNIRVFNKDDIRYLPYLKDMGGNFVFDDNNYFNINIDNDDEKHLQEFINKINIVIPFNKRYIPQYKTNINSEEYLYNLALKGLEKRCNGVIPDNYKERLNYELSIIKKMGFIDYFLIVYDYVLFAKKNNILVGPGRGSAAGSLVSFAIGITDIDPIKYDLLFARFLNPSRKKMPDIDIDFEDDKRSEVIEYVKNRYGNDKVAVGITFSSLKSKMVLRDTAKILKIDNNLFEKFIKNIDGNLSLKDNLKNETIIKFIKLYPELNKLYDVASHLENLKKNISIHAAGVVICSESLDNIIPIYDDGKIIRTGIAMDYLEKLGILKMDFLALRNLSLIGKIVKKIDNLKISDIPLDDSNTFKIFKNANTDNIFQFESKYAKNNLLKLNVSSFNELVNAVALVRPGPSDQIDLYVKNMQGYKCDSVLKDILKDTYGVVIYQEQVMKVFEKIALYTEGESDNVRIAMSKKKNDILDKEIEKFTLGALKNGYSKEYAINLFNKLKRFAEYGFNKSHSVSYALIAYQMAYLKANYPVEFITTILSESKDSISRKNLINELKNCDIKILKPNINVVSKDYQYKNNHLLLPFTIIKGVTEEFALKISQNKYTDIFDFCLKCHDFLNDKLYETLCKAGLLASFGLNIRTLIENKEILLNYAELNDSNAGKPVLVKYDEYSKLELLEFEEYYYGFYVGNHPCSSYTNVVKVHDIKNFLYKRIKMVLLVDKVSNIKTKKNDDMCFITASDETGTIDLTLFPDTYKTINNLKHNEIIFIEGKPEKRFDKYQIIVNNIKRK